MIIKHILLCDPDDWNVIKPNESIRRNYPHGDGWSLEDLYNPKIQSEGISYAREFITRCKERFEEELEQEKIKYSRELLEGKVWEVSENHHVAELGRKVLRYYGFLTE